VHFVTLRSPSAGFEPATCGFSDKPATTRPPKVTEEVDAARKQRRALELKFKGKRPMGWYRMR
jgi:hypothetical protein